MNTEKPCLHVERVGLSDVITVFMAWLLKRDLRWYANEIKVEGEVIKEFD